MRILPCSLIFLGLASTTAAPNASAPTAPGAPAPAAASAPTTSSPPLPLTLTYLGVAGWSITDGSHTILSDPYFSRPSFADGVPITIDETAITAALAQQRLPARADVIVI